MTLVRDALLLSLSSLYSAWLAAFDYIQYFACHISLSFISRDDYIRHTKSEFNEQKMNSDWKMVLTSTVGGLSVSLKDIKISIESTKLVLMPYHTIHIENYF